ncbi:hypothetical protein [Photobacterium damselae]|uniref:hypothetical protein n=1 Tax=Photobacterium damselae TaxID=38293 RepID=UPI0010FE8681|nr:hypothetical protein [Photobacterium damselae]MCG3816104.1 hypothetical protein [Photobacterium damselae]TLS79213.1 hypothetical protein FD721_06335 [Photobacterium damselae subsp. damselae]TLS82917.1 hypothetical protein FD720_21040 [Photobacterium damselae subsp. damselae]
MKKLIVISALLSTSSVAIASNSPMLKFREKIPLTCGFVMENADIEGSIQFSDERNSKIGAEKPATFRVINNGNDGYAKITMRNFSVWNEQNNFGSNGNKTDVEKNALFEIDNGLVGTQSVKPNAPFTVASGIENKVNLKLDIASFRFDADSELEVTTILDVECI